MALTGLRPWFPSLGWAAVIFVLSSFPGSAYPQTDVANADKLVHAVIYGLLGGLVARGFVRGSRMSLAPIVVLATVVATLYGMSDELHQRFVPGRNSDWHDVAADAVGGLLGAAAVALWAWRRRGEHGAVR
jgi:VanZ family protein